MYLHRIELHGFKSFADRTSVQFDPGITAIVGPNGCGKSNVIDAVRWVLGEQRPRLLRSDRMEGVIFNGTASRRPLGMAEVALTVHNTRGVLPTAYSEVTIGRRLYRSGESEYLLNGTPCRLKDILDLFMDTGMGPGAYSVIELKMVEDLLSENAQDRRRLFEEAAGVTKYKLRRTQALRRLDATQADLDRLRDLTEEIGRTVKALARQAKKAERHRALSEELAALERHLAAAEAAHLRAERADLGVRETALADTLAALDARRAEAEAEVERLRTALVERERALQEAQRAHGRHVGRLRQAETEARLAAERLRGAEAARERLDREAEEETARRGALEAEVERLETETEEGAARRAEAERLEAEARAARDAAEALAAAARARRDAAEAAVRQAAEALRAAERALETHRSRRAVLAEERDRTAAQQAEAETTREQRAARRAQTEAEANTARARQAEAEAALAAAEARHAELGAALEAVLQELREAQRRHDAARAEADLLAALVASTEGLPDAAAALLEDTTWATDPRTVADTFACPPALRRAVDAALGPLADALVVRTAAEAHAGAARLRAAARGRATFLVLERLPERGAQVLSPTPPGTEPLAAAVSAHDAEGARLARLLLTNWFVAPSLAEAERLAAQYPVARLVTPDGEWAAAGMLRAGSEETTGSAERIGRREQLEAAEAAAHEAAHEAASLEARADALRAERAALDLPGRREAVRLAERDRAAAERAAAAARLEAETEERRAAERAERLAALDRQLAATANTEAEETARAEAEQALAEAEAARETALAETLRAETTAREALERHGAAQVAAARARTDAEALQREHERALEALRALDRRAEAREAERARIETARAEAEALRQTHAAEADALRHDLEALDQAVRDAEQALLETRAALSDAETRAREARRAREAAREEQATLHLRLAELQTRLDALADRLRNEHDLHLDDLAAPPEDFDAEAARRALPELRQQLRDLGAVNALALETYTAEKERLDFLLAQQADLERAEASLRQTIREINATARARFEETFEAIRTAFQRLFRDLFGEHAAADLALAGDDPLEDDVVITARPKGKKPSAITQLSGGEKTLTAIALLFAIYLVKPSPFCILDEVDAPLDDANVGRFMRLVRSFTDTTQFILVTHNKLTMEAADRMYGVTMQEEGVSTLVGVRFERALPEAA